MTEEKIMSALAEKPLTLNTILKRLSSSGSSEELQVLLMRMRDAGKLKFDIQTGRWRVNPGHKSWRSDATAVDLLPAAQLNEPQLLAPVDLGT